MRSHGGMLRLFACALLCSCAATPLDPLDPQTLGELSDRTLERQWRWVHEPGRNAVPGWPSEEAYAEALRREAVNRHPEWGEGYKQAILHDRLMYDMTEQQALWAVGPPASTLDYRFGNKQFTKWVGPVQGLNASWIVIFSDGVVVDIKDRR